MVNLDEQFKTLADLEAQVGRPSVIMLLGRHRENVNETLEQLQPMKTAVDSAAVRMTAHRMRGACGSLGFHLLADLFAKMHHAVEQADLATIPGLITQVEQHNAQLTEVIAERYPEIAQNQGS